MGLILYQVQFFPKNVNGDIIIVNRYNTTIQVNQVKVKKLVIPKTKQVESFIIIKGVQGVLGEITGVNNAFNIRGVVSLLSLDRLLR